MTDHLDIAFERLRARSFDIGEFFELNGKRFRVLNKFQVNPRRICLSLRHDALAKHA
jgi:hypothetical protein